MEKVSASFFRCHAVQPRPCKWKKNSAPLTPMRIRDISDSGHLGACMCSQGYDMSGYGQVPDEGPHGSASENADDVE